MNINNNKFHQCSQCKKDFQERDVYRIGIKQKAFFCHDCTKNIKSCCMWCDKKLTQKKWTRLGGYSIKAEEGQLTETIDRDNHCKERHYKYYLICPEELYGKDWIKCCRGQFNRWWVDKANQRYQDRKNQGWKKCAGKGIYHKDPKTGKVIFDLDCYKLVPPGQKYCGEDSCIYYTAVYNNVHSKERKRIADKWNQRNQEKYQKANDWWNSLSLAEKQVELKKEEEHLKNLGLQRQRCWIENIDQNSILFENDKLYYDKMDKIPPSFLHKFGLPGYQWENVWKNNGNSANVLQVQTEIKREISNKETSLRQAKEKGENEMVAQLEQQIQELKKQQKNNSSAAVNSTNNNEVIACSIVGFSLLALIGIAIILAKQESKNPKIK